MTGSTKGHGIVKRGPRRMGAPRKPLNQRTPARSNPRTNLTPKQRAFVQRYLLSMNATRAYAESHPGCAPATARSKGSELLKDRRIAQQVAEFQREIAKKLEPTQKRTLQELASIGFSNAKDFFDKDGRRIPMDLLPRHVAAAIKKVKSTEILGAEGETVTVVERELELHDKVASLRMIGQHAGLFAERIELEVGADFATALREARARAIAMATGASGPRPAIEGRKVEEGKS